MSSLTISTFGTPIVCDARDARVLALLDLGLRVGLAVARLQRAR